MIVHVLCLLIWAARAVELTEILLNSHFDEEYKDVLFVSAEVARTLGLPDEGRFSHQLEEPIEVTCTCVGLPPYVGLISRINLMDWKHRKTVLLYGVDTDKAKLKKFKVTLSNVPRCTQPSEYPAEVFRAETKLISCIHRQDYDSFDWMFCKLLPMRRMPIDARRKISSTLIHHLKFARSTRDNDKDSKAGSLFVGVLCYWLFGKDLELTPGSFSISSEDLFSLIRLCCLSDVTAFMAHVLNGPVLGEMLRSEQWTKLKDEMFGCLSLSFGIHKIIMTNFKEDPYSREDLLILIEGLLDEGVCTWDKAKILGSMMKEYSKQAQMTFRSDDFDQLTIIFRAFFVKTRFTQKELGETTGFDSSHYLTMYFARKHWAFLFDNSALPAQVHVPITNLVGYWMWKFSFLHNVLANNAGSVDERVSAAKQIVDKILSDSRRGKERHLLDLIEFYLYRTKYMLNQVPAISQQIIRLTRKLIQAPVDMPSLVNALDLIKLGYHRQFSLTLSACGDAVVEWPYETPNKIAFGAKCLTTFRPFCFSIFTEHFPFSSEDLALVSKDTRITGYSRLFLDTFITSRQAVNIDGMLVWDVPDSLLVLTHHWQHHLFFSCLRVFLFTALGYQFDETELNFDLPDDDCHGPEDILAFLQVMADRCSALRGVPPVRISIPKIHTLLAKEADEEA